MKSELKITIIIFSLLSLTQLSIAELKVDDKSDVQSEKPKKLKVENGATKIGEDNTSKSKMRAIRMELQNESNENTNLNVGKLEFYVK